MPRQLTLLLAFFWLTSLSAQDSSSVDGPYLLYENGDLVAHWAWPEERRKGSHVWEEGFGDGLPEFPAFRPELIEPRRAFHRAPQVEFTDVERLAVMSDIHGQYNAARKLLLNAEVIDENNHWVFGEGHLVIVGDIFDRGPDVTPTLWLIHNLQQEAERAGGRVHFLLGNHETMILGNDVRYLNKRYNITAALLKTPYYELYGPDSYLGRWLRSLPLTVKINETVYVHGGFSKDLLKEVNSISKINDTYHRYLIDKNVEIAVIESEKLAMLYGRAGPLWYRGYFLDREFSDADIKRILKKLGAERLIVGHTSFNAIQSYFGGRVLAVDSSIKFGSTGELLLIDDGLLERVTLYGDRLPLEEATDQRGR